ncbi:hypothetical protein Bbelb_339100 [Branchiostoma belcheri]|nr:hypothetical protein Bbelb_339100 [Branchiostoma belcheri]
MVGSSSLSVSFSAADRLERLGGAGLAKSRPDGVIVDGNIDDEVYGVIVDGNIHDDFHGYYSLTTPFTTCDTQTHNSATQNNTSMSLTTFCTSPDSVIVDGNIHDDFHGYYSLTTPFTTWVIDVSTDLNSGLDLSGLSRVEMHLWGSLVSGSRDRQPLDNLVIDL